MTEDIFEAPLTPGFARQAFVLTDGETSERNLCVAECSAHSAANRIFKIGIGKADLGLVGGDTNALEAEMSPTVILVKGAADSILLTASASGIKVALEAAPVEVSGHELALQAAFAFRAIAEMEQRIALTMDGAVLRKIVELSVQAGVLSKYTAYVASAASPGALGRRLGP
jgi:hypothetical protein